MDVRKLKLSLLSTVYGELMNGADPSDGPRVRTFLVEALNAKDGAELTEDWLDNGMGDKVSAVRSAKGLYYGGEYAELMLWFWSLSIGPLPRVDKPALTPFANNSRSTAARHKLQVNKDLFAAHYKKGRVINR